MTRRTEAALSWFAYLLAVFTGIGVAGIIVDAKTKEPGLTPALVVLALPIALAGFVIAWFAYGIWEKRLTGRAELYRSDRSVGNFVAWLILKAILVGFFTAIFFGYFMLPPDFRD